MQKYHYLYSRNQIKTFMMNKQKQGTICVQGGWKPKKGEPRVLPIYQSTTFKYETSEQMGKLFDLEESGYFYTRLQNPTNDVVASKIADLEGGVAAMLTSSGQAASFYALFNIKNGDSRIGYRLAKQCLCIRLKSAVDFIFRSVLVNKGNIDAHSLERGAK
jgi:cystathionine beta-lyase/cystathionine gamma-synthase